MPLYVMKPYQIDSLSNYIKEGYSQKHIDRKKRDSLLKLLRASQSPKVVGAYIAFLRLHGVQDESFTDFLPQALEKYPEYLVLDVLDGPAFYPDSLLPQDKKPSRSTKKLYSFHIDTDQLDQLKVRADHDGRSVAGTLRLLVRRYLEGEK